MQNNVLFSLICEYQKGNMIGFEQIYELFEKLNIHYSRRLNYDDAQQELDVFLVELLYKIRLQKFSPDESCSIQKYIAVSIKNQYFRLSKQKDVEKCLSLEDFHNVVSDNSFENGLALTLDLDSLSETQKTVLYKKYICNYSDAEIGKSLGISRQAVNRVKNRGLKILRSYYSHFYNGEQLK